MATDPPALLALGRLSDRIGLGTMLLATVGSSWR
jgi:hypothetical protein